MEYHDLSFGKIFIINDDLAEVVVDGGIEITTTMVSEFHGYLLARFQHPFGLLINKTNAYSTEFNAQTQCGTLKQIKRIAIYAPTNMATLSANFMASVPRDVNIPIKVFNNRDDALHWLDPLALPVANHYN
ncbi:STAS/SEC14 domain-containing protein [Psychrobium sp. 1_MG-2023]|uniref:STAS/SEC14 domain-containing protein n=1 Tax=Psychrobium sp. 1_MG-2023 TaxID=3062624 RepID=UPI000C349D48|nr:STAS/SEC14 domain-containing protein [Psychrobium sp. 1_MG-2023]MDP2560647.1 STAS/SEC14 domain-containing protein [Psychrobium sp. 1_MG-2023]PKF56544.1 STAS/SEC14 domain-containing protein [Alteromonadales bacterium alter-6D02]